jgi:hypothetical protein
MAASNATLARGRRVFLNEASSKAALARDSTDV